MPVSLYAHTPVVLWAVSYPNWRGRRCKEPCGGIVHAQRCHGLVTVSETVLVVRYPYCARQFLTETDAVPPVVTG